MERKLHLLLACLIAFPAVAQTVVNKGDTPPATPPNGMIIHHSATAIPIQAAQEIPEDLQVPKEALTEPGGQQPGGEARPDPTFLSAEAMPLGPGSTVSPAPKEIIGGDGSSARPGVTIVPPPVPAIHVGTRGVPPRPEAPSE